MQVDESSLRALFHEHDRAGRGTLDVDEFRQLLAALGCARSPAALEADFAALEHDERGRLTYFEFARWWEVRSAFDHHDADGNGTIDLIEFRRLVATLGGTCSAAEVEAEFDALDRDEDGLLEDLDFARWWKVRNAFERVDADHDGTIDLIEFRQLVAALGSGRRTAEVEADFNSIDRDEGGLLEFSEFARWWEARSAFDRTDRDRRGAIDRIEFQHLMHELGGARPEQAAAEFDAIAPDDRGLLEFSTFARWWRARRAFERHDHDQTGTIDLIEFRALVRRLGRAQPPAEVEAEFDAIDREERGLIGFAAFARWWTRRTR